MGNVATWTINQYLLIACVAGVFGLIGYRRGVRRELTVLLLLLAAIAIVGLFTDSLVAPINRFGYLLRFAREGGLGAEDPTAVWREIRGTPELIQSERNREMLKVGLFSAIILVAYLLTARFGRARSGILDGALGFAVGTLNGVAIVYFLLPILFPEPIALIQLSTEQVQNTFDGGTFRVQFFIVLVVVLIAFGLYTASGRSRGPG